MAVLNLNSLSVLPEVNPSYLMGQSAE